MLTAEDIRQSLPDLVVDENIDNKDIPSHSLELCDKGDIYLKEAPAYDENGDIVQTNPITIDPKGLADRINKCLSKGEPYLESMGYTQDCYYLYEIHDINIFERLGLDVRDIRWKTEQINDDNRIAGEIAKDN